MVKFKKQVTKKRINRKQKATTQKGGLFKDDKHYLLRILDDRSISDYGTAKMVGVNFNLSLGNSYLAAAMAAAKKDMEKKVKDAKYLNKYATDYPTEENKSKAANATEAAKRSTETMRSVERWFEGKQLKGQIESPDSNKNKGDPLPMIPYDKVKERADVYVVLLGQLTQDERYYLNEKICKRRDMGLRFSNVGLRSKTKDPRYKSALDYVLKRNKLITLKLLLKCGLLNCPDIDIVSAINHRLYNILKELNDITCIEQFNMFKVELEFFNTMIIIIVEEILSRKSELRKIAVYLDKRLKQLVQKHTTVPKELLALMSELLISPEGLYTLIYKNLEDKSNILLPRPELAPLPEGWVKVVDPEDNAVWYENETTGVSQWTLPVRVGIDCHMERIKAVMEGMKASAPLPKCSPEYLAQYRSSGSAFDQLSSAAVTYSFTAPSVGILAAGGSGGYGGGGFGGGGADCLIQ